MKGVISFDNTFFKRNIMESTELERISSVKLEACGSYRKNNTASQVRLIPYQAWRRFCRLQMTVCLHSLRKPYEAETALHRDSDIASRVIIEP